MSFQIQSLWIHFRAKYRFTVGRIMSPPHLEKNRHYSSNSESYEAAVDALNNLQNNAATILKSVENLHLSGHQHMKDTQKFLLRSGITYEELEKLSIIHVSGTKGKGSTCSLVDSILKSHGLKTGFYSSPHLISVNERIRIFSKPISKPMFAEYFWKVYNKLESENSADLPPYFKFLTIMALHVFLNEKVDVAVLEVGIGGQYDCTNVVRHTKTVGITSLGLEHTKILGETIEDIAWQKSGIIKEGCNVFTYEQPEEAMEVIQEKCDRTNSKLFIAPPFSSYKWHKKPPIDKRTGVAQEFNAALAIELSRDWLRKNSDKLNPDVKLKANDDYMSSQFVDGFNNWTWPGRYHVEKLNNIVFYLDGAHTIESVNMCIDWFQERTKNKKKILLFNVTGGRDFKKIMSMLIDNLKFDDAIFVPTIATNTPMPGENIGRMKNEEQLVHCQELAIAWNNLSDVCSYTCPSHVRSCVSDVIKFLNERFENETVDVLVTGTLHLVGATLQFIELHKDQQAVALK